jgi:PqqD family protein of HPr-rel-A system
VTPAADVRWRIAAGQRLVLEDLDDGVLLYDARVGGTHLLNATAAEMLSVIEDTPGLTTAAIRTELIARMELAQASLPLESLEALLQWLAQLNIVARTS